MAFEYSFKYNIHTYGITQSLSFRKTSYSDVSYHLPDPGHVLKDTKNINSNSLNNLSKGYTAKGLTASGRKNIIQSVEWLANLANYQYYISKKGFKIRFKIQMITLTFATPEKSGTAAKKCLNKWLTNMRKNQGLVNYVWRAERHKSGGIHFHIVTDSNLPLDVVMSAWNWIQKRDGYTDRADVNSTDVKRFNSASSYIAKYAGKLEDGADIEGRVWGRSRSLDVKKIRQECQNVAEFAYHWANGLLDSIKRVKTDWANIVFIPLKRLFKTRQGTIGDEIKKAIKIYSPVKTTTTSYNQTIELMFKQRKIALSTAKPPPNTI